MNLYKIDYRLQTVTDPDSQSSCRCSERLVAEDGVAELVTDPAEGDGCGGL